MRKQKVRLIYRDSAFTLVEILVAMALIGIVAGAIYGIFISSSRSYHNQDRIAETQQRLRLALDFMVREIRMAGFDPIGNASDPIGTPGAGIKEATAAKVRFTSDVDMDGVIEEQNGERITYLYHASSSEIRRGLYEGTASEVWHTLVDGVSAVTFVFLDEDGAVTATVADMKTVAITVTCQGKDIHGDPFFRSASTRVRCRNL
jgi:type IV pilus assembly protein PilW